MAETPRTTSRIPYPQPTVLVVDDDSLLRWSLREKLGAAGYRVVEASSGTEALEELARESVDIALFDLQLPDTDGLTLLTRAQQSHPACRILMMSAFTTPEAADQASLLGARRFVGKPFDLDDMVRLVEQTLAG